MRRVVAVHLAHGVRRFAERIEREEAAAARDELGEPGVLRDDRLARRQVADAPIAEPAAARARVDVLRDRELTARSLHVARVGVEIGGMTVRVGEPPTTRGELRADGRVVGVEGELERLRGPRGETGEAAE